jgi:RNA polymerase sigma factor (sigma-70 family)
MAPVSLDAIDVAAPQASVDVMAVAEALTALAAVVPRASQVVELRFFGGFSVEETAEALGVSPRTVNADWNTARAWLSRELTRQGSHGQ